jgi:enoyl-CoA hydratase/carnithine racemase
MIELSRRNSVAVLTLARPPVNAIDEDMIQAIHGALDRLSSQPDWSVLHIRSEQKVFAAGADLAQIRSWKDAPSPGAALSAYVNRLQSLYNRIEALPQITFCEISGAAMGGGYELALSCDLRMAADEARIGLPEVGLGLIPGAGGTQRLTRLCGPGIAKRIILGAEPVDGKTALSLGMVEWSIPRSTLAETAESTCQRLASLPGQAQAIAKECIGLYGQVPSGGYGHEMRAGGALLNTEATIGLISAFLDRNTKK